MMIDNSRITQEDIEDLVANVSPRIVKHNTMVKPKKAKRRFIDTDKQNIICNDSDKTKI